MRGSHVRFSIKATWLGVLGVLMSLTSCHRQYSSPEQAPLPYKVSGTSDRAITALQARFDRLGVRVIIQGQDYLVSVPSVALFPSESPQLTWGSYALLNDIACYIKQFRKVSVTVTAFSSPCASVRREHALTLARAKVVANYLWSQGIDSRFIFTQGLASDKPIVTFAGGGDKSPNSRVEITFREAIA